MVVCFLIVEGGGETNDLRTKCRKAFSTLLKNAGFGGCLPRIIAAGTRKNAYDTFCAYVQKDPSSVVLLVDSEDSVSSSSPWSHVEKRAGDNWVKPSKANDQHLHFMAQCMESWFIADVEALKKFYGQGFISSSISTSGNIETITKTQVFNALQKATKATKTKGSYDKSLHSFEILPLINHQKLVNASPWASRFFLTLENFLKKSNRSV